MGSGIGRFAIPIPDPDPIPPPPSRRPPRTGAAGDAPAAEATAIDRHAHGLAVRDTARAREPDDESDAARLLLSGIGDRGSGIRAGSPFKCS